ncbi:MAG: hypothetical protein Kow0075_08260 [Salibacteraceae bacterium]
MVYYLTYNERPNGLYQSQVLETLDFVNDHLSIDCTLIAFVSWRTYFSDRYTIKKLLPKSRVFPSIPKFIWIAMNGLQLLPILVANKPVKLIGRGPLATFIVLFLKRHFFPNVTVCLDSRGLAAVEDKEYGVYPPRVAAVLPLLEQRALALSDCVSVITDRMKEHLMNAYDISDSTKFVTIPCTISDHFVTQHGGDTITREKLGIDADSTLLAYVGSTAKWQSFGLLINWLDIVLGRHVNSSVLLLCERTADISELIAKYPGRVVNIKVPFRSVYHHLKLADYGLLLREASATNWVSSPTKTAEYLISGLPIITNRNIQVAELIADENVGIVLNDFECPETLQPVSQNLRQRCIKVADNFSKNNPVIKKRLAWLYAPK